MHFMYFKQDLMENKVKKCELKVLYSCFQSLSP